MRAIDGPGHVGNTFVDYDAILNPNGTVMTADWGNDAQNELIGIQDNAGIAEAAGTNLYVLSAITKQIQDYGKHIGEMYFLDSLKTETAFDKDDLEAYFNGKCLDAIDVFEDIAVANWPDLVPHLRAKGLTYNEGITGSKAAFDVTDWDITANVSTLTFANTTAEIAILTGLLEDNLVHGSYTDWRSITLAGAIGDITSGEYAITAIDTTLRTVKFAFTAGNNSGSGSFTINFFTNRVPSSSTTARLYEATARTLVSANDDDGENINGLRRRDRFQGHAHNFERSSTVNADAGGTFGVYGSNTDSTTEVKEAITDAAFGTARTGETTDTRSAVGHLYLHGRSFIA